MPAALTADEAAERRSKILHAARWCFLNFGFAKTSFEDIAKRANISRTLLYRIFKDKEDLFTSVFAHWLVARHPEAQQATKNPGTAYARLIKVCKVMVLEPWTDMAAAPMGTEFYDVCARMDPEIEAQHRTVARQCVTAILGNKEKAEVFLLALDGLCAAQPATTVLERRVQILAKCFVQPAKKKANRR